MDAKSDTTMLGAADAPTLEAQDPKLEAEAWAPGPDTRVGGGASISASWRPAIGIGCLPRRRPRGRNARGRRLAGHP
jgi:hypothetical protein